MRGWFTCWHDCSMRLHIAFMNSPLGLNSPRWIPDVNFHNVEFAQNELAPNQLSGVIQAVHVRCDETAQTEIHVAKTTTDVPLVEMEFQDMCQLGLGCILCLLKGVKDSNVVCQGQGVGVGDIV